MTLRPSRKHLFKIITMIKLTVQLMAVVAFFALAVSCSDKTMTGTGGVTRAQAASTDQFRVLTYNIHHGNPPSKEESGEIELDAIARVIRQANPDLVALQEVDVNTGRSGPGNQAEVLGEKLGMHAYFGKAIDYDGGYYGVAILSKYPISEASVIPLPEDADPKAEDRVLALAKVTLPGGKVIRFGSTHLDVRNAGNRDQQVKRITEIALQESMPFIVAGDFNATPESSSIEALDKVFTRTCLLDCEPTIPVNKPTKAIDFIAFTTGSPFQVVSQEVIPERYASDHLPVVATLRWLKR